MAEEKVEKKDEKTEVDVSGEARKQGWVDQEEWVAEGRDPDQWVDAGTFVERGKTWAPHLAAQKRELQKDLQEVKQLLREQMRMNQRRRSEERGQYELKIKEYKQQVGALEARLAEAVKEGDGNAVVQITRDLRQTETNIQQASAAANQPDPELLEIGLKWRAANPWYDSDEDATAYADSVGQRYSQRHPDASPHEVLEHVKAKVLEKFPEHGPQGKRPAGPGSSSRQGSTAAKKSDGMTWESLDSDEQRIASQVMRISGLSKEEYLKQLNGK